MDPFQTRLRFLSTLHRLNASLPSIQKSLSYIVDYGPTLHSELWSCIIGECKSGSINRRINLFFLIDSIFTDETLSPSIRSLFRGYLQRDLYILFDLAIPEGRWDALLNVPAVSKILATWKARFVLDRNTLEDLETLLEVRKASLYALSPQQRNSTLLPPSDMQRRIEEDRERHKRLREKSWVLPPTAFSHHSMFGVKPEQLDPTYLTRKLKPEEGAEEDGDRVWSTQDLDFSQMWEETSDFNDDDIDELKEGESESWVVQKDPPPQQPVVTTMPTSSSQAQIRPPTAPASMRLAQRSS
ncbi:uncharacterized protein UTRI_00516 [Ustilago trichophora]|uniref:CID domain-containing protein n=1 Tax=Ustilago trichophora TaxID=86804 RepID=A0A5C3DVI0_9BASI|nr:uncharacterized protein UTRI_00516 [Ustilago trichophora]